MTSSFFEKSVSRLTAGVRLGDKLGDTGLGP